MSSLLLLGERISGVGLDAVGRSLAASSLSSVWDTPSAVDSAIEL